MQIKGLKRLRISSIEASQIDDRFISLLKKYPAIAPHLHIPLQSGSDTVLQRMKRKYSCEEFYQKIKKIKEELPDVALACDVIVGFPQETEEEFLQTGEIKEEEKDDKTDKDGYITYDNVAIPEIHIKRKK